MENGFSEFDIRYLCTHDIDVMKIIETLKF